MCGRFSQIRPSEEYEDLFEARLRGHPRSARYNIAPTQEAWVVTPERDLMAMRFGLVPSWSTDNKFAAKLINARAETLHEKPSFRPLIQHRRCLIPADGFFEWRREGSKKVPVRILHKDSRPWVFAGLYDIWQNSYSFTIITCEPNSCMREIHDRMPVILGSREETPWLRGKLPEALELLVPCPSEKMTS